MFDFLLANGIFEDWRLLPKEMYDKLTPEEIEQLEREKIEELLKKIEKLWNAGTLCMKN